MCIKHLRPNFERISILISSRSKQNKFTLYLSEKSLYFPKLLVIKKLVTNFNHLLVHLVIILEQFSLQIMKPPCHSLIFLLFLKYSFRYALHIFIVTLNINYFIYRIISEYNKTKKLHIISSTFGMKYNSICL